MRTYKILKARAQAFDADTEVRAIIADVKDSAVDPLLSGYTRDKAVRLRALAIDATAVAKRGLRYERLDQLMMEHLLGVR
jgi:xylose isomerase